jgi:hypothetical protein
VVRGQLVLVVFQIGGEDVLGELRSRLEAQRQLVIALVAAADGVVPVIGDIVDVRQPLVAERQVVGVGQPKTTKDGCPR